jgi:RNA polymerase sigma-70 factor (ECF subfamily)
VHHESREGLGPKTDDVSPNSGLSKGVQDGDTAAVARLFELYARRLARLAEQHLSPKLAGRVDGEDVVQSAFRTFFRRSTRGEFKVDSSAQIWQLLTRITLLKAHAKARYHTAGLRDVGKELPGGSDERLRQAVAHEPGPADAAALVDHIDELLHGLPELYATVLEMRLQGSTAVEIAAALNVSRRTVERALNLLQERLARAEADTRS